MGRFRTIFKAPWDWLLVVMTIGVTGLLLGINYVTPGMVTTIITWTIILGSAGFGIYGYSIQDGKLKILRLGWSKDIDLSQIDNVEYHPSAMSGSIRVWGIGGLFGYVGYFRNSILKQYKAYVTHRGSTVIISTAEGSVVVSPDDPKAFISALNSARPHSDEVNLEA